MVLVQLLCECSHILRMERKMKLRLLIVGGVLGDTESRGGSFAAIVLPDSELFRSFTVLGNGNCESDVDLKQIHTQRWVSNARCSEYDNIINT